MANEIKWIKFIIGCTDGTSFKKMRSAEIGGVNYRDKLEAVWFELLDFAGQCNRDGYFIDGSEIAYCDDNFKDLAAVINRSQDELQLCMSFYIKEHMVEIVDDVYALTNWSKYQSVKSVEEVREQDRLRQQKRRKKLAELDMSRDMSRDGNVTVTQCHAPKNIRTKEYKNTRNKELKENSPTESKRKSAVLTDSTAAFLLDSNFKSEKIKSAFMEFLDMRAAKGKRYKVNTEHCLKLLIKKVRDFAKTEEEAIDILNYSTERNYDGLFDPAERKGRTSSFEKKTSIFDRYEIVTTENDNGTS